MFASNSNKIKFELRHYQIAGKSLESLVRKIYWKVNFCNNLKNWAISSQIAKVTNITMQLVQRLNVSGSYFVGITPAKYINFSKK